MKSFCWMILLLDKKKLYFFYNIFKRLKFMINMFCLVLFKVCLVEIKLFIVILVNFYLEYVNIFIIYDMLIIINRKLN